MLLLPTRRVVFCDDQHALVKKEDEQDPQPLVTPVCFGCAHTGMCFCKTVLTGINSSEEGRRMAKSTAPSGRNASEKSHRHRVVLMSRLDSRFYKAPSKKSTILANTIKQTASQLRFLNIKMVQSECIYIYIYACKTEWLRH